MVDINDIYHLAIAPAMFAKFIGGGRLDGAPPRRLMWGIADVIEL